MGGGALKAASCLPRLRERSVEMNTLGQLSDNRGRMQGKYGVAFFEIV